MVAQMHELSLQKARLEGQVTLAGAKNAALRLLAASLLSAEPLTLQNYPAGLLDAEVHVGMLQALGKTVQDIGPDHITLREDRALTPALVWPGRSIRNTLLILGALTARLGAGRVPHPGGCALGGRPWDLHVLVLEALGARVWQEGQDLCAEAPPGGCAGPKFICRCARPGPRKTRCYAPALRRG